MVKETAFGDGLGPPPDYEAIMAMTYTSPSVEPVPPGSILEE